MELNLSSILFEWLLADWAGYHDEPAEIFPSLKDVNVSELSNELSSVLSVPENKKLC